eukprot:188970-Chlamydomonas_euryale.AAC.1
MPGGVSSMDPAMACPARRYLKVPVHVVGPDGDLLMSHHFGKFRAHLEATSEAYTREGVSCGLQSVIQQTHTPGGSGAPPTARCLFSLHADAAAASRTACSLAARRCALRQWRLMRWAAGPATSLAMHLGLSYRGQFRERCACVKCVQAGETKDGKKRSNGQRKTRNTSNA